MRTTAFATALFIAASTLHAQDAPGVDEQLRTEAAAVAPLVQTDAAQAFLKAVEDLPPAPARTVYRTEDRSAYYSARDALLMPREQLDQLEPVELPARFYYTTRYGTPVAYARAIDIAAKHGWSPAGSRVMDFGYGGIGHLRLLASLGADVTGVEVDPLLPALYTEPSDKGLIQPSKAAGATSGGVLELVNGQWPAQRKAAMLVGDGYDLFLSKNVLKRGYIHPAREADPRRLVHLGVDDETYLRALFDVLNPGGLAVIYNLSPKQNPPEEEYIPWADGECPFEIALIERAGFEILEFDVDDTEFIRRMARALGWVDAGMDVDDNLFAHYTVLRRPESTTD